MILRLLNSSIVILKLKLHLHMYVLGSLVVLSFSQFFENTFG